MTRKIHCTLGALWMALCGYFFATLLQGIYEVRPDRLDTLCVDLFFVLLFAGGLFASFYVLIGARWARFVLGIIALLTVTASVMGLFAFFNSLPSSFVAIVFDVFALASAGVLLFAPKYDVA
jgi:hypothetical protein